MQTENKYPDAPAATPGALLKYGTLGWALGCVAVPIYIQITFLYTRSFEVPAEWVGFILLSSRLIDAFLDPFIGLWLDRRNNHKNRYTLPIYLSVPLLLLGMYGVFFPFGNTPLQYAFSLFTFLFLVHLGFSLASIAYQSWGAELGKNDNQRSMFVATREGIGILGVIFAVSLAIEKYAIVIYGAFFVMLLIGAYLLTQHAPRITTSRKNIPLTNKQQKKLSLLEQVQYLLKKMFLPLSHSNYRRLMAVFLINGLSVALPATLVRFFMEDRLGLPDSDQWVLGIYFLVGAAATTFWVWLGGKINLAKAWLCSMVFSIPTFIIVVSLNQGDLIGFAIVCALTGFALGADLSLPAALVAKLINENKESGLNEGSYFGLWNWINTCNLALAPSLSLIVLGLFNYSETTASSKEFLQLPLMEQIAQDPLIWMYALVPCVMRFLAIILLTSSGLINEQTTKVNTKQIPPTRSNA